MTNKITGRALARANSLGRQLNSDMSGGSSGYDSDRYNGALLRTDERLSRLFKAYSRCDDEKRDEIVRLVEQVAGGGG